MYEDLASIEDGMAALTATLDPALVHGPDALVALERSCRIMKLATTTAMLLGKRVHETDAWKPSGKASAAHLLADLSGITLGEAMALLGTARKMAKMPKTDAAARQGRLSGKQAAEVAKGAAADPAAEDDLLDLADEASTSELAAESKRRRLAAAGDDQRRHARIRANRALHRFSDDDGAAVLRWKHLPEIGAELDAILADYVDDEFADARRDNRREQRCAYAADALVAALRDAAAFRRGESIDDEGDDDEGDDDEPDRGWAVDADADADADDLVGTDVDAGADPDRPGDEHRLPDAAAVTGTRRDGAQAPRWVGSPFDAAALDPIGAAGPRPAAAAGPPGPEDPPVAADPPPRDRRPNRRTRRRAGERSGRRRRTRRRGADAKVIVRIDHAALLRGSTEPGEICEIAGIGPVPVASVAELMEDAFLAAVVTKGHDVCTVAHLGRQPNAHQQTGLEARGVCCSVLGCPNTHRLERDHREDWARTRHTRLDELDWLCPHHHALKTHQGYRLANGVGRRPFLSPDEQRARSGAAGPTGEPAPATPPSASATAGPRRRATSAPASQPTTRTSSGPPVEALTLGL